MTAPLVKEVVVGVPVDRAWEVFTAGIDRWWPAATHSTAPDRVREVAFEARLGGRILERWDDGTELSWGEVEACDPPNLIRFSWHPNPDREGATEVEVTFTPSADGTRVRLEHRGWERLGDEAPALRADYDGGWDYVLGRYLSEGPPTMRATTPSAP